MVSATEAQVDEELQSWLISVLAAMVILSTVAFTLRIVSRRVESQSLWWDDALILISTVRCALLLLAYEPPGDEGESLLTRRAAPFVHS